MSVYVAPGWGEWERRVPRCPPTPRRLPSAWPLACVLSHVIRSHPQRVEPPAMHRGLSLGRAGQMVAVTWANIKTESPSGPAELVGNPKELVPAPGDTASGCLSRPSSATRGCTLWGQETRGQGRSSLLLPAPGPCFGGFAATSPGECLVSVVFITQRNPGTWG